MERNRKAQARRGFGNVFLDTTRLALVTLSVVAMLVRMMKRTKEADSELTPQRVFIFDEKLRYVIGTLVASSCLWIAIEVLTRLIRNTEEMEANDKTLQQLQSRMRIMYASFSLAFVIPLLWYSRERFWNMKRLSTKYHVQELERRISILEARYKDE